MNLTNSDLLKKQYAESFEGKRLLITGGTGSFGHTVLKHFLEVNSPHLYTYAVGSSLEYTDFLPDFC